MSDFSRFPARLFVVFSGLLLMNGALVQTLMGSNIFGVRDMGVLLVFSY